MGTSTSEADPDRPIFTIQLTPTPGCADPHRVLRRLLKFALTACALKCISSEVRQ
jgi:hypothetical protein